MMASGWHSYIGSSPETYGISIRKETKSWDLIEHSGRFGINFLPAGKSSIIHSAGTLSGFDGNKFITLGVTYQLGKLTRVPILDDAYLSYECLVTDIRPYGDHCFVVGEIIQTYKNDDLFLEDGSVDLDKLEIPLYIGRSIYRTLNVNSPSTNHWKEINE